MLTAGVVGRNGAGKSSIMIALFRMSELSSGAIEIDGVDVSKIGLNDLRSGVSIIPQDPLLFSGTLRTNIDPFNEKTDIELYDALRRAHLVKSSNRASMDARTSLAEDNSTRRFTLDTAIEEEGGNLSVGERSLVSLVHWSETQRSWSWTKRRQVWMSLRMQRFKRRSERSSRIRRCSV